MLDILIKISLLYHQKLDIYYYSRKSLKSFRYCCFSVFISCFLSSFEMTPCMTQCLGRLEEALGLVGCFCGLLSVLWICVCHSSFRLRMMSFPLNVINNPVNAETVWLFYLNFESKPHYLPMDREGGFCCYLPHSLVSVLVKMGVMVCTMG